MAAPSQGAREWSLPAVLDVVTEAVPDRDMLVWTSVRRTYAEVALRTRRLAGFFQANGVGVRRERPELDRWECGQSRVALLLANCPEYIETMIAAYRARAVPYNVNHHYHPREIAALLDAIGADAVVYHRALGPRLAEALAQARPGTGTVLVDVDDGSGVAPLPGGTPYEGVILGSGDVEALPEPSPDDLYLICTGGTTGLPKGVLWRQADVYVSGMGGVDGATADDLAGVARTGAGVWFAASPLMHSAGQRTVFSGLAKGATAVLHDDTKPFDAKVILETVARERVTMMTIVGDAYARPMVEELRGGGHDLSTLRQIGTGGAATNPAVKRQLLELLPEVTIVDGYGSSETGGMGFTATRRDAAPGNFSLSAGTVVLSADRSRRLGPGDEEIGWAARAGRVPLGYLNDRAKTEQTFPVVGGQRMAVPGDRARLDADGKLVLLGRDSMVINSGGEKVFVEEVEEAIRRHPEVLDALVVGRPHDRFGQEVVALVQARPGAGLTPVDIREFAARSVARFKAPRAVLFCDRIGRHPSGKPDYAWATRTAVDAVPATGAPVTQGKAAARPGRAGPRGAARSEEGT
jgi:fatty-acyl-CoA synthase